jgi:hypothetical protein
MKTRQLFIAVSLLMTGAAFAADYQAPADIVAKLPKYCWSYYLNTVPSDDEEHRITGCGSGVNHYCPGLVQMAYARQQTNLALKKQNLDRALWEMDYTTGHTPEDCWLQPQAQLYKKKIKMDLELLELQMRVKRH